MTDIVYRLRLQSWPLAGEAADEIDRLRSRLAEAEGDFQERMTKALLINEQRLDELADAKALLREVYSYAEDQGMETLMDMIDAADSASDNKNRRNREICYTYDAFYDPATGEWLEGRCGDPACEFCEDRPDRHPEFCNHGNTWK